ncbi:hypothetical protein BGZ60DRAFT_436267 [Tricladium varicosporioides]|nr:hypothetical protein BGZ60DRAFT_436267 [Hymenoscyphus varicosporioides]
MSFPTVPAYTGSCKGWEERLKEHPVMDFMFSFSFAFDEGTLKTSPDEYKSYLTDDFTFVNSSGQSIPYPASWPATTAMYAPFTSHFHEPFHYVITPTAAGYDMVGQAMLYANLPVPSSAPKVKDLQGREWDLGVPGAFHFSYVKDEGGVKGLRLSREVLFADGISMVKPMIERGMIGAEDAIKGPGSA